MREQDQQQSTHWPLTPLVAVLTTAVGVIALYYAQAALVPALGGGCDENAHPACGLGIGVQLIGYGFGVACVALIAGVVVALRHRTDHRGAVLRRGLLVAASCLALYVVLSAIAWLSG